MMKNRVKEFRTLHQLTQEQLAERIGINMYTIQRIESNPDYIPSGTTMLKLANYFNCQLGVLFFIEREETEKVAS